MVFQIEVEVDLYEVETEIRKIFGSRRTPHSSEIRRAYKQQQQRLVNQYKQRYYKKSRTGGRDWPKLEPSTVRRKGNKIKLIEDGNLVEAIESKETPTGFKIGIYSEASASKGSSWTLRELALNHQSGTSTPKGKVWKIIPQLRPKQIRELTEGVVQGIIDHFEAVFGRQD